MNPIKIKYKNKTEWLSLRQQGIGGSDAAAVCGLSPYKSPLQVYMEKIGEIDPPSDNKYMEWGRILEPIVAQYFSEKTNSKLARVNQILINQQRPWMLANIDRRIIGKREGLEVKTTSAWNAGRINKEIPDDYAIQCYHYLAVTGWERWHLAILIGGNDFRHFVIERDEEIIENLISIEERFWKEHVEKRIPPEPVQLYPQANEKLINEKLIIDNPEAEELVKSFFALREEVKSIENKIKALMGEYVMAKIGKYKVSWKPVKSSRFDAKKFQRDYPDLYSEYSYTTEYRRLSIKKED